MSNREWWPAFMADEVMPAPESTPTEWVREALCDRWLIAERKEDRCDEESIRQEITPGETMDFIYLDRLPDAAIRILEDGSCEVTSAPDQGANFFSVWDEPDFCGNSLDQVARELADQGEHGDFAIYCAFWSDEIPHRFEIGEGGPRFVAIADIAPLPGEAPDLFKKES